MSEVEYYKRFRMELDLRHAIAVPVIDPELRWLAWDDRLLEVHARVKYESFHGEVDRRVFPNLGSMTGCQLLMSCIRNSIGFHPPATWLISNSRGAIATVQGLFEEPTIGAIQNVGVMPGYRRGGLGRALVLKAVHAFREAGAQCVALEVTACNIAALRLYRELGFRAKKTVYRTVVTPDRDPIGANL